MNQTILIVDDDPVTIKILGNIVRDLGKVCVATNGKDALRLAREVVPDLILLDAQMPGVTGFQVCEELRVDRDLANVPVIFVSSHDEAAFEVAGLGMDFIVKPVNAEILLAKIKAQLM